MAAHIRKQIRDAAVTALTGLTTTGAHVFPSAVYPLQDKDLPALRIDTGDEDIQVETVLSDPPLERMLQLLIQACVKQNATYNDTVDTIISEVEIAIAAHQALGGAKYVALRTIKLELAGEGEKPIAIVTMTFEVPYFTAQSAPDVAL